MNGQDPGWWVTFRHELPREDSLPAGDWAGIERRILELEATRYRYYVTRPGEPEREVSVDGWRQAEREAGFIPKLGPGFNATAGFTANGIHGRTELLPRPAETPDVRRMPSPDQETET